MKLELVDFKSLTRSETAERNLILVQREGSQDIADFVRIRGIIAERAPDIEVFIANAESRCSVTRRHAANRPTLVFSPTPLFVFKPARGKIYCGHMMTKIEEYRRFKAAGLPVPEAVMLEPSTKLDPVTWGPFTILKPIWASGGRGVTLERTRDVQWVDPISWPKDNPRHGVQLLAQKFIDTGPYSTKYRVLGMFGRVLYCERQPSLKSGPVLDPNGTGPIDGIIASDAVQRANELNYEADVLAFAPSAAKAFPEVPVLAIDLIREVKTNKLYILEVNPGGNAWHLSSPIGKRVQARLKIDRYKQFDALTLAADALIEKTRTEAV
jgi:hypothetical protein